MTQDLEVKNMRKLKDTDYYYYINKILKGERDFPFPFVKPLRIDYFSCEKLIKKEKYIFSVFHVIYFLRILDLCLPKSTLVDRVHGRSNRTIECFSKVRAIYNGNYNTIKRVRMHPPTGPIGRCE